MAPVTQRSACVFPATAGWAGPPPYPPISILADQTSGANQCERRGRRHHCQRFNEFFSSADSRFAIDDFSERPVPIASRPIPNSEPHRRSTTLTDRPLFYHSPLGEPTVVNPWVPPREDTPYSGVRFLNLGPPHPRTPLSPAASVAGRRSNCYHPRLPTHQQWRRCVQEGGADGRRREGGGTKAHSQFRA